MYTAGPDMLLAEDGLFPSASSPPSQLGEVPASRFFPSLGRGAGPRPLFSLGNKSDGHVSWLFVAGDYVRLAGLLDFLEHWIGL
jgi:hypothetical protein